MKNIYVLCPAYITSGGPEALHQLVFYLNKINKKAFLVYIDLKNKKYSIPEIYKWYVNEYLILEDIENIRDEIVIMPETLHHFAETFIGNSLYIWWLSVDNDVKRSGFKDKIQLFLKKINPEKIFPLLKRKNKLCALKNFIKHRKYCFEDEIPLIHLCASYYAFDYVSKRTTNPCELCIEPISLYYLENIDIEAVHRKDIVLYNPAKNFSFTKKVINYCSNLKFIALRGFNQKQLKELYMSAKVYMDFGFFPGAERIPKEAILNGCCVLTGRYGASAYHGDVPIPDDFKIEANVENLPLIKDKLYELINNSELNYEKETEYKDVVMSLEKQFIIQLLEIFKEELID